MPLQTSLTRAYTASADDVDEDARTVVARINTATVDRYRTVILPEGGQFAHYRKNPVVLFNHGGGKSGTDPASALPIGRNLWIKSTKKELIAKTEFLPVGASDLADKVFRLYALGYLNAWSISFDPIESGRPTADELRRFGECQTIYRIWDLTEYSCVTVPGNPEATRQARALGLELPGWDRIASSGRANSPAPASAALPPLVGRSLAQVEATVRRSLDLELAGLRKRAIKDAIEVARGMI